MADDIKLLKDAINVGEKTLLNFINKNIDKKEKALHTLQAEENNRMKTPKRGKAGKTEESTAAPEQNEDEEDSNEEEEEEDDEDDDEKETSKEPPEKLGHPIPDKTNATLGNNTIENIGVSLKNTNDTSEEQKSANNTKFNELVNIIAESLNNNIDVKEIENGQTISNQTVNESRNPSTKNNKNAMVESKQLLNEQSKRNFTTNDESIQKVYTANKYINNQSSNLSSDSRIQIKDKDAKKKNYNSTTISYEQVRELNKVSESLPSLCIR